MWKSTSSVKVPKEAIIPRKFSAQKYAIIAITDIAIHVNDCNCKQQQQQND